MYDLTLTFSDESERIDYLMLLVKEIGSENETHEANRGQNYSRSGDNNRLDEAEEEAAEYKAANRGQEQEEIAERFSKRKIVHEMIRVVYPSVCGYDNCDSRAFHSYDPTLDPIRQSNSCTISWPYASP